MKTTSTPESTPAEPLSTQAASKPARSLYEVWTSRDLRFEPAMKPLIEKLSNYGAGRNAEQQESRGRLFGAGYEVLLVAFFLGLYAGKRRPLDKTTIKPDNASTKVGQLIKLWGYTSGADNGKAKQRNRRNYNELVRWMFAACVAKTEEVDFLALDRGELTVEAAASALLLTAQEFANHGLHILEDVLDNDPGRCYSPRGLLDIFLDFATPRPSTDEQGGATNDQADTPEDF